MSSRLLAILCLCGLLVACSSDKPAPAPAQAPSKPASTGPGPLPSYQRALTGTLVGAPAGAEIELALLVIDARNRPQRMLGSIDVTATGQPQPFELRFNPEVFPSDARVELRGRASRSGQLILHLPSQLIGQPNSQALGTLTFAPAP